MSQKLIFIGNYTDDATYKLITEKCGHNLSQAARLFQQRLINSLSEKNINFEAMSVLLSNKCVIIPESFTDLNTIVEAIPVSTTSMRTIAKAMSGIKKRFNEERSENILVLMYAISPIALIPLLRLKRKREITLITICPELPQFRRYKKNIGSYIKRKIYEYLNRKFDKYIVFSDAMREYLPNGKPCMLLEGFAPDSILQPQVREKNIAMYAGGLAEDNGIRMMIEAAHKSKYIDELWICGVGACQSYVEQNTDSKVKYLGRLPNTEVLEREKLAKALLNIRDPRNDLTRFSFPSKVLEYMAAGGIVISSKLSGIPKEYDQHIKLLEEYTASNVAANLDEIFRMSDTEFLNKTGAASKFVESKTANQRADSILKFIVGDELYEN